ncbi:MAG TPA: hypothetical protein DCL44_11710 [Elusimicrobia bacterium]|nr:hypothetical protein [Elusimicrobiota bacterium]
MFKGAILAILAFAVPAFAGEGLLYLEAQVLGGYSSLEKNVIYHSMSADEAMQRSSVGFDLIHKASSGSGDKGTLALQGRLAWDPGARNRFEPQVYNAYYRIRTHYAYIWAGHNRTAAGLESYFDTHGALLQTLPMYGYGFDRDWGLGASHDFTWGDAALSLTAGSGMPLRAARNYLASGRISKGVLSRDNYSGGVYFSIGRVPETIDYHLIGGEEKSYSAAGADFSLLWDRWELRSDLRGGRRLGRDYLAGLGRLGLNLLDENRLKLEAQGVYSGMKGMEFWTLAAGFSFLLTPDLSWRSMFEHEYAMNDRRVVTQLYYYFKV